ncbi:MAG TPA: PadR family transcriptional regulator [Candidatus Acidoferrum sp.]|jgi:DNA-binding PadR family transcriptional regulator|nr:PadR family transcriptional regulator [Candidatus Acidoferrum sp.]
MAKVGASKLSTADLVLLSLLAERPMHGYQANAELERRQVRDWAGLSRPQIYYSLEKLARNGFLRTVRSRKRAGPERRVFLATTAGRSALANALERPDWTNQREKPTFLTWIALSWQARKGVFLRQLVRRQKFIEQEIAREKETLKAIRKEVGHPYHEAIWMVTLVISEFENELCWLAQVRREMKLRAGAKHAPRHIEMRS